MAGSCSKGDDSPNGLHGIGIAGKSLPPIQIIVPLLRASIRAMETTFSAGTPVISLVRSGVYSLQALATSLNPFTCCFTNFWSNSLSRTSTAIMPRKKGPVCSRTENHLLIGLARRRRSPEIKIDNLHLSLSPCGSTRT